MITDVSEWLRSNGVTPSELSEELGLPRSQISRFIAKEEEPDRVVGWALVGLGSVRTKAKGPQTSDAASAMPVAALAQDFADDSWTARTARLALPILVEIAQGNPRQITYADLHE